MLCIGGGLCWFLPAGSQQVKGRKNTKAAVVQMFRWRGCNIMREFLMKLSNESMKRFIIHAPDPSLIKMKQGLELVIAASPRNRSDS